MSGENLYGTTDFHEVAYCLCKKMKIVGREKKQGEKVAIILEGHNAHVVASEYFNGGRVVAREFAEALRSAKDYAFK